MVFKKCISRYGDGYCKWNVLDNVENGSVWHKSTPHPHINKYHQNKRYQMELTRQLELPLPNGEKDKDGWKEVTNGFENGYYLSETHRCIRVW